MKALEFKNVSKSFCKDNIELKVLDDINFSLKKGEIIAITGPSGCGKSTILNLICGLTTPTKGEVITSKEVGYMFQHDHLLGHKTVYENIIIGLVINKKHKDKKHLDEVNRLIETYNLKEFTNSFPKTLSGGMRQRVALIRTLAINPDILLLDEPFASLDYQTKLNVIDDIYEIIKKEHKSTIIVTHDFSEAIMIADKVIVLSNRPSKIKCIIDINTHGNKTPTTIRKSKEYNDYFNKIRSELMNV